jgi:hypothetical protein
VWQLKMLILHSFNWSFDDKKTKINLKNVETLTSTAVFVCAISLLFAPEMVKHNNSKQ